MSCADPKPARALGSLHPPKGKRSLIYLSSYPIWSWCFLPSGFPELWAQENKTQVKERNDLPNKNTLLKNPEGKYWLAKWAGVNLMFKAGAGVALAFLHFEFLNGLVQ